MFDRRKPKQVS